MQARAAKKMAVWMKPKIIGVQGLGIVFHPGLQTLSIMLLTRKNWLPFQLNLDMINENGEGDTSSFVLNGEWHLLGKESICDEILLSRGICLFTISN